MVWNPWFNSFLCRFGIENVIYKDNKLQLSIQNNGSLPVPIKIIITYEDNTTKSYINSHGVERQEGMELQSIIYQKIIKIKLGDRNIPDAFPDDNYYVIK